MKTIRILSISICLALLGCTGPSVPDVYTDSKSLPKIYPDYTGVTVPV